MTESRQSERDRLAADRVRAVLRDYPETMLYTKLSREGVAELVRSDFQAAWDAAVEAAFHAFINGYTDETVKTDDEYAKRIAGLEAIRALSGAEGEK